MEDTENTDKSKVCEETKIVSMGWWAKITQWLPDLLFKRLEEPVQLFTIEDVQDYRPFLTKNTWSLEGIFCRPKNSRYIAIVNGPGALTRAQLRSSLICSVIGSILIVLIVVSFLVWFRIPGAFLAFVIVMCFIVAWSSLKQARNLYKVGKDLVAARMESKEEANKEAEDEEEEAAEQGEKAGAAPSEAVYVVSEYKRVTEATDTFCAIMFGLELGFFFIFPLVVLLFINWNIGVLFLIVATVSGIRHYINAAVVIEETGNMDLVGGHTEEEKWERKSRLNEIVEAITVGKARKVWTSILGVGGFAVLAIFLGAVGQSTENTDTETLTYLQNFSYPSLLDDMRYPTCTLSGMTGGFGANTTLADYAFLASIAYRPENLTQPALDAWFGDIEVIDEQDIVDDFRERKDPDDSAVFFKLVSFPKLSLAVIMIRGTSTQWDMLADMQLWSAAALMQGLRAILPVGEIWTPIFDRE
jgi:lipase ATG15